jgi:hypothetical protein
MTFEKVHVEIYKTFWESIFKRVIFQINEIFSTVDKIINIIVYIGNNFCNLERMYKFYVFKFKFFQKFL